MTSFVESDGVTGEILAFLDESGAREASALRFWESCVFSDCICVSNSRMRLRDSSSSCCKTISRAGVSFEYITTSEAGAAVGNLSDGVRHDDNPLIFRFVSLCRLVQRS